MSMQCLVSDANGGGKRDTVGSFGAGVRRGRRQVRFISVLRQRTLA